MAPSGVIYEEAKGDLSPFPTSHPGEIETPLYKVIIVPFFLFRYSKPWNNANTLVKKTWS